MLTMPIYPSMNYGATVDLYMEVQNRGKKWQEALVRHLWLEPEQSECGAHQ
jgi:hypothetical protein